MVLFQLMLNVGPKPSLGWVNIGHWLEVALGIFLLISHIYKPVLMTLLCIASLFPKLDP